MGWDHADELAREGPVSSFLHRSEPQILAGWMDLVQALPDARGLTERDLLDEIPQLLRQIGLLADVWPSETKLPRALADHHALARLHEGYDLTEVILEYALLRQAILRAWDGEAPTSEAMLHWAIDRLMTAAAECFAETKERTLAEARRIFGDELGSASRLAAERAEQRAWLEAVIDNVPVGILVAEAPSGRFLMSNRQAELIWRRPIVDVLDFSDYPAFILFRPGSDVALTAEENCLINALQTGAVSDQVLEILRGDGTRATIESRAAPVRDPSGHIIGGVAAFIDVTERREMEAERERLLAETRDAVRLRETILGIVSHDLRTPLSVVTLNAGLLGVRRRGDAMVQKAADTIMRAAGRMQRLIADLLDVASIQAGRLSLDIHACELRPLLEDALAAAQPKAAEKKVRVTCELKVPATLEVWCDRERALQVFGNVVGNAVKFSPPEGVVKVTVTLDQRSDEALCFEVRDAGPGIPTEAQADIFQPYWTTKQTAEKGTGLGLYITKTIIDAHGGRVWVESTLGAGSAFFFTLPIASTSERGVT